MHVTACYNQVKLDRRQDVKILKAVIQHYLDTKELGYGQDLTPDDGNELRQLLSDLAELEAGGWDKNEDRELARLGL